MTISIPLLITYFLSIIVMIGLPVLLAIVVLKRFKVSWIVMVTGIATFIVGTTLHGLVQTQVIKLFQNGTFKMPGQTWQPIVIALIVGLLAGLFEESARWLGFTFLGKKRKKYGSALALGVGHGGIESILLAAFPWFPIYGGLLITLITVTFFNPGAQIAKGIPSDQVQYMLAQINQFWMTPWHTGLLPGVERLIGISTQILLSIMVWKSVTDRSFVWFVVAMLYHTVINAVAVFLNQIQWNYWAIEGVLAVFMLLNIYLIYRFIKEESEIEKEIAELGEDEDDEEDDEDDDNDEEDAEDDENDSEDSESDALEDEDLKDDSAA